MQGTANLNDDHDSPRRPSRPDPRGMRLDKDARKGCRCGTARAALVVRPDPVDFIPAGFFSTWREGDHVRSGEDPVASALRVIRCGNPVA